MKLQMQFKEKNPLLTRDDVGRSKPTTHDLPSEGHAYGIKLKREEFGVAKLTSEWHLPEIPRNKIGDKDYQKLNKMGVEAKIARPT